MPSNTIAFEGTEELEVAGALVVVVLPLLVTEVAAGVEVMTDCENEDVVGVEPPPQAMRMEVAASNRTKRIRNAPPIGAGGE